MHSKPMSHDLNHIDILIGLIGKFFLLSDFMTWYPQSCQLHGVSKITEYIPQNICMFVAFIHFMKILTSISGFIMQLGHTIWTHYKKWWMIQIYCMFPEKRINTQRIKQVQLISCLLISCRASVVLVLTYFIANIPWPTCDGLIYKKNIKTNEWQSSDLLR